MQPTEAAQATGSPPAPFGDRVQAERPAHWYPRRSRAALAPGGIDVGWIKALGAKALAQGPDFRQLLLNGARGGAETRFQAADGLIVEAAPVAAGGGGQAGMQGIRVHLAECIRDLAWIAWCTGRFARMVTSGSGIARAAQQPPDQGLHP